MDITNIDVPKLLKQNLKYIPYIAVFWFVNIASKLYRHVSGGSSFERLVYTVSHIQLAMKKPFPSLHPQDLVMGIFVAGALYGFIYYKSKHGKKFRKGVEHGSARWGTPEDIKPFMDSKSFKNNIILTQTERLTMGKPSSPQCARNKNVLVVGGSGSGKTRFFVKPNLLQGYGSYCVTDPKGTVLLECGEMLRKGGYDIKVVNTINFSKSMKYNPFAYLKKEKDVLVLVNTIISNTKGEGDKSGEDFWVKAERMLLTALIAFIWSEAPREEQNINTLLEMINSMEVREDDETFKNPVDLLFDDLEQRDAQHFALRQYQKYKLAAGKTAKSILISAGARLAPFDIAEVRSLMEYDEIALDTLGDSNTALFLIMSDSDKTFDFIIAMIISQMFNVLMTKADDFYGGSLPVPVQCLFDEFANVCLPNIEKTISVCRSRNIGMACIVQNQAQLKAIYKDHADTIIGNCDSFLFLGGIEKTVLEETSKMLGKETIDVENDSENKGKETSHGKSFQKVGKELMTPDELSVMDGNKCILRMRGVRPFISNKFDITKHPKYKQLSDFDKKNLFDVHKFINTDLSVKNDDVYEVIEIA